MKKYLLIALMAFTSCINPADDYYSAQSGVIHNQTVLEYLDADGRYARFMELLRETGVDLVLADYPLVTVFAPADAEFPENISSMDVESRKQLVLNHIVRNTVYAANIEKMATITTLSGKKVAVTDRGGKNTLDGVALTETDHICRDGVVHGVQSWIPPRKNLAEWLCGLDDSFSIVRDSIRNSDVRIFDKDNSPVSGVDENGRIVYDSVWVVTNRFLNDLNLADESIRYTVMAPSDASINRLFEERNEWLEAVGHPLLDGADSSAMLQWILGSALIKGANALQYSASVRSVCGKEVRTAYFEAEETQSLSNGSAVILKNAYVPKDLHYSRISFNPYHIRLAFPTQSQKAAVQDGITYDTYYPTVNPTVVIARGDSQCANLQYNSTTPDVYYYKFMSAVSSDSTANAKLTPLKIMPGVYNLRMRFCTNDGNLTDSFDIYRMTDLEDDTTDEFLATVEGVTKRKFGEVSDWESDGLVKTGLEITSVGEPVYLKVVIPKSATVGTQRRMFIGTVTLVPADNY